MKRFYKYLAIFMVCTTLSTSIFVSADIKANAAAVPVIPTVATDVFVNWIIAVLAACGIVVTADFVMENMSVDEFIISFLTMGTTSFDKYGAIDFSNAESFFDFTTYLENENIFSKNVNSAAYIDAISYSHSGTSATATFKQILHDFNNYVETEGTSALQQEMTQTFTVINGGKPSGGSGGNKFDKESSLIMSVAFAAAIGTRMDEADDAGGFSPFYAFDFPKVSGFFGDYDFANYPVTAPYYNGTVPVSSGVNSYSLDGVINKTVAVDYPVILASGYTDLPSGAQPWAFNSYPVDSSGNIVPHYYVVIGSPHQNLFSKYCVFLDPGSTRNPYYNYNLLCFNESGALSMTHTTIYQVALIDGEWVEYSKFNSCVSFPLVGENSFWNFNLPMFDSLSSAQEWFNNGASDHSSVLNYGQPSSYSDFKTNVGSAANTSALESLQTFMSKEPTVDDVISLGNSISSIPSVGTDSALVDIESTIDDAISSLPNSESDTETFPEYVPGANLDTSTDVETEPEIDPETGQVLYTGILGKILNGILAIARNIWGFFQNPIEYIANGIYALNNGLLRIIEIIPGQLGDVLGNIVILPQSIFDLFSNPLQGLQDAVGKLWTNIEPYLQNFRNALEDFVPQPEFDVDLNPDTPGDDGTDSTDNPGFKFTMILDGLIILILILLMLLSIFLHCLEFIINVFKIPATTGFLPEDMVTGFNFIKTLEIPGLGMSVYDFMMGLVYILLVFGVVGVLRKNIDKIRLDR